MKKKGFTPEQIIAMLGEAEVNGGSAWESMINGGSWRFRVADVAIELKC